MKWVAVAAADHGAGAAFKVRAAYDANIVGGDATALNVVAAGAATGTELGSGAWHDTGSRRSRLTASPSTAR